MEGFCDSDYASGIRSRSTAGLVYILNSGALSWNSKLQKTVALSMSDAEYMTASHAVKANATEEIRHNSWSNEDQP